VETCIVVAHSGCTGLLTIFNNDQGMYAILAKNTMDWFQQCSMRMQQQQCSMRMQQQQCSKRIR
jgi:hypothetical protein